MDNLIRAMFAAALVLAVIGLACPTVGCAEVVTQLVGCWLIARN